MTPAQRALAWRRAVALEIALDWAVEEGWDVGDCLAEVRRVVVRKV